LASDRTLAPETTRRTALTSTDYYSYRSSRGLWERGSTRQEVERNVRRSVGTPRWATARTREEPKLQYDHRRAPRRDLLWVPVPGVRRGRRTTAGKGVPCSVGPNSTRLGSGTASPTKRNDSRYVKYVLLATDSPAAQLCSGSWNPL